jgi:hypothetical protein
MDCNAFTSTHTIAYRSCSFGAAREARMCTRARRAVPLMSMTEHVPRGA